MQIQLNKMDWNQKAKRLLKAELVKRGITNEQLAKLLSNDGASETKSSVDSKISRGTFSASFLIHSLHVIRCNKIEINTFYPNMELVKKEFSMMADSESKYRTDIDE